MLWVSVVRFTLTMPDTTSTSRSKAASAKAKAVEAEAAKEAVESTPEPDPVPTPEPDIAPLVEPDPEPVVEAPAPPEPTVQEPIVPDPDPMPQSQPQTGERTFTRAVVVRDAFARWRTEPHAMAGALSLDPRDEYTDAQVKELVKKFLEREIVPDVIEEES